MAKKTPTARGVTKVLCFSREQGFLIFVSLSALILACVQARTTPETYISDEYSESTFVAIAILYWLQPLFYCKAAGFKKTIKSKPIWTKCESRI